MVILKLTFSVNLFNILIDENLFIWYLCGLNICRTSWNDFLFLPIHKSQGNRSRFLFNFKR